MKNYKFIIIFILLITLLCIVPFYRMSNTSTIIRDNNILLLNDVTSNIDLFNDKEVKIICYMRGGVEGLSLTNFRVSESGINRTDTSPNNIILAKFDPKRKDNRGFSSELENNIVLVHGILYKSGYFGKSDKFFTGEAEYLDAYILIKDFTILSDAK